jgi:hypothetical protein
MDAASLMAFGAPVGARTQRGHGSHVFVAGGEALAERHAAFNHRRWAVVDDLQVGCINRYGIDPHQHLGASRHRSRFFAKIQFAGIAQNPGLHRVGDWEGRRCLHVGMNAPAFPGQALAPAAVTNYNTCDDNMKTGE